MEFFHKSVLLDECIEALNLRPDGIYLDGTLGGAGHSSEIVKRLTTGRLIGVDRDRTALAAAEERLRPYLDRVTLVHSNFSEIRSILRELSVPGVDGMLFDLGVSSPQLDDAERGFSYMADAPLDMRMDRDDAAKRCFQAIRIAVNDELGSVRRLMDDAIDCLNPGGRLAVITFHSLEDRIVKTAMQAAAKGCTCPPEFPVCVCGKRPRVTVLTRKPIVSGPAELAENPRARSAKLRVAEKL